MYANMEQCTEIRRQVLVEGMSKRQAWQHYQINWKTIQKVLRHGEPPGYWRRKPVRRPIIEPVLPFIEQILKDDTKAPKKKQRHTAKRIWERLRKEHGFSGGQSSIRAVVREMKATRKEVFLPLSHPPGEAQVDFGFAKVVVAGVETDIAVFVMSMPYSDAVYCQVFPRECTETFQEGHARAFAFFGGVPRRITYENAKTTVAKIVTSRDRTLTHEFLRLKSYYLFESHFCLVRRPNERGSRRATGRLCAIELPGSCAAGRFPGDVERAARRAMPTGSGAVGAREVGDGGDPARRRPIDDAVSSRSAL